jgi:hypothetical protein
MINVLEHVRVDQVAVKHLPHAAAEVRRCFDLVRGGASMRKAAAIMTAETGRPWTFTSVGSIVKRDTYKLAAPGRIVDPRVWNDAQAAMASRRKRAA